MELREIIKILKKEKIFFFGCLLTFIFVGIIFIMFQKDRLVANVMINVTRKGVQQTQDYRYDNFYRLQADEKFADTVVRWVSSPAIKKEVMKKAGIENEKNIKAKRMSAQMIEIIFTVENKDEARKVSDAIFETLNAQTEMLNKSQNEEAWFSLISNPVEVADGRIGRNIILAASFLMGLFIAFFGAMFRNYMKE